MGWGVVGLTGGVVLAAAATSAVVVCNTIGHRGEFGELLEALSVAGDKLAVHIWLL